MLSPALLFIVDKAHLITMLHTVEVVYGGELNLPNTIKGWRKGRRKGKRREKYYKMVQIGICITS